VITASKAQTGA